VELDSTFALAFAKLSGVHGELYFWGFDKSEERLARCRMAAERALELQPDLPEAHLALGGYYYMGFFDYDRALRKYSIAAKGMPNSPELLEAIAYIWRRQGLYQEALGYLEKAAALDPRHFWYPMQIGLTNCFLRQYAEAEPHFDRSLFLEPEQIASYVFKWLNVLIWTGDVQKARAVLESSPVRTAPAIAGALLWQYIYERDYQGALNHLSDLLERARASYDSARVLMEAMVQEHPEDGSVHSTLGLVYAGLGHKDDAIREGKKGMELYYHDAINSANREWDLVWIYILLEEYEDALDHIEHLLSDPSLISVPYLKIHPDMDPLRDHPRFKQILSKYSENTS